MNLSSPLLEVKNLHVSINDNEILKNLKNSGFEFKTLSEVYQK